MIRRCPFLPLILALTVVGCRTAPQQAPPPVEDPGSLLGLAAQEASRIDDELARADLYVTIAEGYALAADLELSAFMSEAAAALVEARAQTTEGMSILIRTAPLAAAAGDDEAAVRALSAAVDFVSQVNNPVVERNLLPSIVRSGIDSGEAARGSLRAAVDEVYVIEDALLRAEALLAIGDVFLTRDVALSPVGLIHQASPAVRAVQDSVARADLFAQLAVLARRAGETDLSGRLASSALTELEQTDRYAPSAELVRVVALLSDLGRGESVIALADRVRDPYTALRMLIAAITGIPQERARENLEKADLILATIVDPAEFVQAEIDVANGWISIGDRSQARVHAEQANGRLSIEPSLYSTLELPSRLAELYVRMGDVDRVRDLLLLAGDPYVRGAVSTTAGDALRREGSFGVADDFYTIALVASDETTYLADALRQGIVPGFAATGSLRLAIRTIERIQDELIRARAVASLAVIAEARGDVESVIIADLSSVLASDS